MQFIPIIERQSIHQNNNELNLISPEYRGEAVVTDWSVESLQYGIFLSEIFDEWIKEDVGSYFVQIFDLALESWLGQQSSLCIFRETCGNALAIEHNGDLYSCDHYVYPEYQTGHIKAKKLVDIAFSPNQVKFGYAKNETLPQFCRQCEYLNDCWGECPKNRIIRTEDGEPGLNYLCRGLKKYFKHAIPKVEKIVANLRQQPIIPIERMPGH